MSDTPDPRALADQAVWVYVAGPYTHPDPVTNTRDAILAAEELRAAGLVPVVPHLSHLWHLVSPHDIDFWYEYDIELLSRCDALLRLPGESSGADAEVAFAEDNFIPAYFGLTAALDALTREGGDR